MSTRLTVVLALLLTAPAALAQTPAPPPGTIEYYHVDALNSVRAVTDASGAVVRSYHYHPFGEGVGVEAGTDPMRFTGKPRDGETGLDYFGARYYVQRTARFSSVDPEMDVEESLVNPQRWNRYAYALNSPYRYLDPDGRNPLQRFLASPIGQRLLNSPVVRPAMRAAERASWRILDLIVRGGRQPTDVWKSVVDVKRLHTTSRLPTEFSFRLDSSTVQVAQNATKHIFEHLVRLERSGSTAKTLELAFQTRIGSLQSAVGEALTAGIHHRQMMRVGGWELMFAIDNGKTILIHALPK